MKSLILVFLFTLCGGCMGRRNLSYEYADGSGNLYRLSETLIEYIPVQPKLSSSGLYSGGNPVKKTINEADYEKIVQNFQAAINNKAIHIENRLMGSGMILIREEEQTIRVLLSQSAIEKIELEALLKELLKSLNNQQTN
jgi:hypothetical protein